ncbi:hypothetical protein [Massilia sp. 9096]|uniref:hypothetical protein n=1 Tax=Massilia sp. 9096 TaxID=1500894 RepID=UPI00055D42B4|nr:hypothetical protein [Massilia sp. 9096]
MRDLSREAISTIVHALISARIADAKAYQDAGALGHLIYQATIQQRLDENAAALRELNQDVAPWLQFHSQLRDVFAVPSAADTDTAQGSASC